MFNDLDEFTLFLIEKNILSRAISFVIGGLITEIVKKIANELINPVSKGEINKLKKIYIFDYFNLIFNFILTSYILFKLNKLIEKK